MTRAVAGIFLASLLISFAFGAYWMLAFAVVLTGGLVFGLPLLLLFRKLSWLSWWHALIAGVLAPLPFVAFYLSMNPGHTEHVGAYNSVYAIGMGMIGGVFVWLVGVFRNPAFQSVETPFPLLALASVPLIFLVFVYRGALAPEYMYGCITDYEPADNPTSWNHAIVTVATEDGQTYRDGITIGASDPAIVGNCAWGSKKRYPTLRGFYFTLHSTDSTECEQKCPNQ